MRREIIHFNQLKIEYLVFGSGKECILCMHGHGRSANDFEFLENKDRKVCARHLNPFQTGRFCTRGGFWQYIEFICKDDFIYHLAECWLYKLFVKL